MIELGLIVIGAYLGVLAIFWGTVLAAALLAMLFAAIVFALETLVQIVWMLALTPRWLWRVVTHRTLT
jgi:hypothetical protein